MYLKRQYKSAFDIDQPPTLIGVKVLRAHKIEHLSPALVEQGLAQGWISMAAGKFTVHGVDGDVVYTLVRTPGYYCCHCDKSVGDAGGAQTHLAAEHAGEKSPDPCNPSGYRKENFYTLVSDTHVENMTPAEAAEMERGVREELQHRWGPKLEKAADGAREKAKTAAKVA